MDAFANNFSFVCNYILQPLLRSFGCIGNTICIAVLWKPSQEYQVYGYQMAMMVNDLCGLLAGTFWSIVAVWTPLMNNDGPVGARRNVFIMWYTAHVANLSTSIFLLNVCLLLSIMAWDRLWGLYFPISYQAHTPKRRLVMIASITGSVLVSCFFSVPDYFRQNSMFNATTEIYKIAVDNGYVNSTFSKFIIYGRQAIRFSAFLALIVATIFIIAKYRKVSKKTVPGQSNGGNSSHVIHHRTVTTLLIAQVVLLIIGQTPESIAYAMIYTGWNTDWLYNEPGGRVFRDTVNLLDITPYWANIVIFTAMSAGFRRFAKERVLHFIKMTQKKFRPIVVRANVAKSGRPQIRGVQ